MTQPTPQNSPSEASSEIDEQLEVIEQLFSEDKSAAACNLITRLLLEGQLDVLLRIMNKAKEFAQNEYQGGSKDGYFQLATVYEKVVMKEIADLTCPALKAQLDSSKTGENDE